MRNVALTALAGLALAGCGGGTDADTSWRDPDAVSFSFGTPTSELDTEEQSAAAYLQTTAAVNALAFPAESDAAAADALGMSVVEMPRMMSGAFAQVDFLRAYEAAPGQPWSDPSCWSVTATEVRYDRCTRTADGLTVSMDGSISRAIGTDGVRRISWDLTNTLESASEAATSRNEDHYRGELTDDPAARTLVGRARADLSYTAASNGVSTTTAVTYNADLDLEYEVDPVTCVDGGTLTFKRLYNQVPAGALPADTAVQFSWVACGEAGVRIAFPEDI